MRAAGAIVLALSLAGCSYGFGDLVPSFARFDGGSQPDGAITSDPRRVVDPAWPCNPVSDVGCVEGTTYCLGDVESNVAITDLRCRGGFGSGSFGTYCADLSFCVAGFLCWTDPAVPGATDGTCAAPCFDTTDCSPGYVCESESSYRAPYAGTTIHRCVPGT